jgi:hypothetical protein
MALGIVRPDGEEMTRGWITVVQDKQGPKYLAFEGRILDRPRRKWEHIIKIEKRSLRICGLC